ncbi:Uncharacterised protein [Yersinia pseudotuberculosis]|uniref:Uncharacterized protein n=1 Tax=Yersinia pseudotuberculosis TaxID=633 RepID=A0A380Q8L6_YERPU|nr:Uncharacterised protein [Yersinia pseudotuberculosis]
MKRTTGDSSLRSNSSLRNGSGLRNVNNLRNGSRLRSVNCLNQVGLAVRLSPEFHVVYHVKIKRRHEYSSSPFLQCVDEIYLESVGVFKQTYFQISGCVNHFAIN